MASRFFFCVCGGGGIIGASMEVVVGTLRNTFFEDNDNDVPVRQTVYNNIVDVENKDIYMYIFSERCKRALEAFRFPLVDPSDELRKFLGEM